MKLIKNISVLFFAMVFLLSSTGIVIFETSCVCTGSEFVSLYVQPETCSQEFHRHHLHDFAGNEVETIETSCHDCATHTNSCGCEKPEVKYIKLINQLIDDEVKYVKVHSHDILVAEIIDVLTFTDINPENQEDNLYTGVSPCVKSSLEFLIHINQLKIPNAA